MTKQNYKDFLESAEYSERKINTNTRKLDFKVLVISTLSLACVLIVAGFFYMKNNYDYLLDLKHEEIRLQQDQINELKESAYDITGQSWKARYKQMDKQFHKVLEYMSAMGYEIDFQYIEQEAK